MPSIWLNITTIYGWQRPAVGIVRVESECASYALTQTDLPVRFCRFEVAEKKFVEVHADDVRQVLDRIRARAIRNAETKHQCAPISDAGSHIAVPAKKTMEQRAVQWTLALINRLPNSVRRPVFQFAALRFPAFQSAARSFLELKTAMRQFFKPEGLTPYIPPSEPSRPATVVQGQVPFAKDDTYISLGLDWDQKDVIFLYEQRQRIGFKTLLFCYDIIPVKLPHLCVGDVSAKFAMYFANLAWSADKIQCISECSRNDLQQLLGELGAPIPELEVVRLGCEIPSFPDDIATPEVASLIAEKYLLFVSTIERRKNHETIYRAYTRLVDEGCSDLPLLVFVGMPGWGVSDLLADLRLDPRIQPYIRILNHVTDTDLVHLYRNAYFTVYPSLYEGWGLPVAESLAYGKFCLAANSASIPEVGGDLIEYLDPWDIPLWAERLRWYIENPVALADTEQRIRNHYKPASWSDCAASILGARILRARIT
ncbi:MAG: hypothetical protein DI604_25465 [Delftia acidovorans]|nr:MAG: hypothetical protein DI604_25465 [Delftia acidovorans]